MSTNLEQSSHGSSGAKKIKDAGDPKTVKALFVYIGMQIVEFCLEVLDTDGPLLDWDSEVMGEKLRLKASKEYSRIHSDLNKLSNRCKCGSTISNGKFVKVSSAEQPLYVYEHNAYLAYSNVMFEDVVKLAYRVSEDKQFMFACKQESCHLAYYPYYHNDDYCSAYFQEECLSNPNTSQAVELLKELHSKKEPDGEDDWTFRLHSGFLVNNIDSEYTADLRCGHVKKSWEGRLPRDVSNNCLLFQGAPDIIVKKKGIIEVYENDDDGKDLPSSQESARLQMAHQMTGIKPYISSSFQPNKIGELVAALHTSLTCRALRKYTKGKTFDLLEAHGLFIHRCVGIIHMKVTLSKKHSIMIASNLLVHGVSTPQIFCAVMKYFMTKLQKQ
ncbi:uncharacterized protein [Dysidea avara]|uniref:uncharacterized protein isoform X2 n=1 Tax=Dysidea avara TaxID=196820 RepID=UPI00332F69C9